MDKLPEELLCIIVEDLSHKELVIVNVSLVSKTFLRLATQPLYYHCCFKGLHPLDQLLRIRQHLDTVGSSPHLRNFIRHIELGEWQSGVPPSNDIAPITSEDADSIVQSARELTGLPFRPAFKRLLLDSSRDAMIYAILSLLPSLESFTLDMKHMRWDEDDEEMYHSPTDFNGNLFVRIVEFTMRRFPGNHLLENWTDLTLHLGRNSLVKDLGWDVRLVSIFIKLPSLRRFTGKGCIEVESDRQWACPEDGSNVTELALSDCAIGRPTISRMLRSFRALESFECLRICEIHDEQDINFDYSYIGTSEALQKHRHSLRRLRIHTVDCGDYYNDYINGPIGSLQAFEKLELLDIDQDALYGPACYADVPLDQLLPGNLEHITYRASSSYDQKVLYRQIADLLLANTTLRSFEVFDAIFRNMEIISLEMPGVIFEETGYRRALVRRRESELVA